MTSPTFALFLCLFFGETAILTLSSSARQGGGFVSVKTGDNLTLKCFREDDAPARLYWYKQTLGQKLQLIASNSFHDESKNDPHFTLDTKNHKNLLTITEKFQNNPRFTLDTENGKNNLTIKDLRISDSATYYCISAVANKLDFLESTFVIVTDSDVNIPALVHQSSSEIIQPGGSVTLNCTVHTGSCGGEHSVYWFKTSQEESHPGLIYTHGGRNDQCERKDDTQTHTCVYNLPMESLNVSHAGTYYCAVASCGHILFGNGTKLGMELSEGDVKDFPALVYYLSSALVFTTILAVLLACTVYKMKKRSSFHSSEFPVRFSASSGPNDEGYQDEDCLHYAAVSFNVPDRSRRQRNNSKSECVYSSVRH